MAYKVLSAGIGLLLLAGCIPLTPQPDQKPIEAPMECPVVEPVVCPEPPKVVAPKPTTKVEPKPVTVESCPKVGSGKGKMNPLGQVEYVDILPLGFRQKARIDTGIEISSVEVFELVEFERDGKPWVKFSLVDRSNGEGITMKEPIKRTVLVKQKGQGDIRRHVVLLTLAIGDLKDEVEVTLAGNESFEYPILIGRNFLQGRAMVDVSRKFLALEK